ncbi:hypothetical protein [Streptomyces sp. NPDC101150]|uniref:hypothetical protein n=1 Tax=Streptomyces sp. NPDC101150 TaxID=3366114 RepID=UPI00380363D6
MIEKMKAQRNPFQETILGLEYTAEQGKTADLFSRACVEQFQLVVLNRFGYQFAQVFEPNVLREVALLAGVPYNDAATLAHRPTAAMRRLGDFVDHQDDLNVVELINTASALVSVSRFELAGQILDAAGRRATTPREIFEIEMLRFVADNRSEHGTGSPRAFHGMRAAIETGKVPIDRTMDACAQAVVWYLKRKELPASEYQWFLDRGTLLAQDPGLDPGFVSAWYRALAMVPAAKGEVGQTRKYMERAHEAAQESVNRRPHAYELHYIKTYYESSLKEHMHLSRDRDAAEEAGRALISLDPAWAPSYGELAEAHLHFGQVQSAAELYETAVSFGSPHVGHHLLQAARCREKSGNFERAADHYFTLAQLVPDHHGVLEAGRQASSQVSADRVAYFDDALRRLEAQPVGADRGR